MSSFAGFIVLALGIMLASSGYNFASGALWPIVTALAVAALAAMVTAVLGRGDVKS